MEIQDVVKDEECCCSCAHNIRTGGYGACHCDINNHYIGYVDNFESVCKEWKKDE